jgi:hypothetical protein
MSLFTLVTSVFQARKSIVPTHVLTFRFPDENKCTSASILIIHGFGLRYLGGEGGGQRAGGGGEG